MKDIVDVAKSVGLKESEIISYGKYIAKVDKIDGKLGGQIDIGVGNDFK